MVPEVSISYVGTANSVFASAQTRVSTTHLVSDADVVHGTGRRASAAVAPPGWNDVGGGGEGVGEETWGEEMGGCAVRTHECLSVGDAGLLVGQRVYAPRDWKVGLGEVWVRDML